MKHFAKWNSPRNPNSKKKERKVQINHPNCSLVNFRGYSFYFLGQDKHRPADGTVRLRPRIIGSSCHHPTSSIDFILSFPPFSANLPRNFTPNEVSMLPPTDYVFRSGVARCTLAGLAARTTRSLLLQTCTGWYGEEECGGGVWSASGQREARERELRPAAGGGTGIWKGQE